MTPSRAALAGAALLAAILLSVVWWRADVLRCACERCPDEHCLYAEHVSAALAAPGSDAVPALATFARGFIHAQVPLPALLAALPALLLPATVSLALVGVASTLLAWWCVRRIVVATWRPDPTILVLLAVAFFGSAGVLRGLARPITDPVGMACSIASLLALGRHVAARTGGSAALLATLQLVGLFSRVSFIPMLGMPVLAELLASGSTSERLRRALRAGIAFGLAPGAAYFAIVTVLGIEHTAWMWDSAHLPQYVPDDRPRALLSTLAIAGGPYLVLGALALLVPAWHRGPTLRIHLAWIALYTAFLYLGGGALWLRYFAPIAPSVVVVATPALAALVRRRRAAAIALVGLAAALQLVAVARWIGDPRRLLVTRTASPAREIPLLRVPLAGQPPSAIVIATSAAPISTIESP